MKDEIVYVDRVKYTKEEFEKKERVVYLGGVKYMIKDKKFYLVN